MENDMNLIVRDVTNSAATTTQITMIGERHPLHPLPP
jgi:hypothetical protein